MLMSVANFAVRPVVGSQRMMAMRRGLSATTQNALYDTVVVIGGGLMGSGIVQVAAASGRTVRVVDTTPPALDRCRRIIDDSVRKLTTRKLSKSSPNTDATAAADAEAKRVLANVVLTPSSDLADALAGTGKYAKGGPAQLVIEAIVENIDAKRALFEQLDKLAPKNTILASNTSSLPIGEIAKGIKDPSRAAEKMVGLHYFNPVPQMKLVEIVRRETTPKELADKLVTLSKEMGKVPVLCKDTPGFIVNRLLVPYMFEAIRLLDRGDATRDDIDTAMKLGAGYPMGPFELLDYVGLDTCKFIADGWYKDSPELKGDPLVAPPESLSKLVENKKFGRKSGSGFYEYKSKK